MNMTHETSKNPSARGLSWLALATLALALASCNQSSDHPAGPLAITGKFTDNFGGTQTISADTWSDDSGNVWNILSYNNASQVLIAQNDAKNAFDPNLFSQFDWTRNQGQLYYCQIAYNAPTQDAAAATSPADATDPASGGCSGFAWTKLTPKSGT